MMSANGIGVGLRMEMSKDLLAYAAPEVRFVEVHPENYLRRGGRYFDLLEQARERWPILTHGLTMSLGSTAPFEAAFMNDLRAFLRDRVKTEHHSDHLCFSNVDGVYTHDLLPLPFNEESIRTASARLREAADALELPVAFENISYYAPLGENTMDELTFLCEVLDRSSAPMLLDVNNVYVNSRNHGFDARRFLDAVLDRVPRERVLQLHVAGHWLRDDGLRIDTHAEPICDDVYTLLEHVLGRIGPIPVLLERDGNFPTIEELMGEVKRLDEIYQRAMRVHAAATPAAVRIGEGAPA